MGWKKIKAPDYSTAEAFLLEREPLCVGACSKFLARSFNNAWMFKDDQGAIAALLLQNSLSLYPIFSTNSNVPLLKILGRLLKKVPIYSLQGLKEDAEIFERGMEIQGFRSVDRIDYDLMTLDGEPDPGSFRRGPSDLILRKPQPEDTDDLFLLHSAYEQEEVIPRGGVYNPASCRKNLEKLLSSQQFLIACLGNEIVGKINTNAVSYTRYQIGGVYVRPKYRGLGIAIRMSAEFLRQLRAEGRGLTLFVKKRNAPARKVYRRLGFVIREDYRICYF